VVNNSSFSTAAVRAEFQKRGGVVSDVLGQLPGVGSYLKIDPENHPYVTALQEAGEKQMRADALEDIRNVGLAGLALGGAGAGTVGLAGLLKKRKKREPTPLLPLPYPAEHAASPERLAKRADFMPTGDISSRAGLPWYAPGMLFAGLGGLGLGYKGVGMLLKARAEADRKKELETARQEFHDALIGQYDKPLKSAPKDGAVKLSGDAELSRELDRLFDLTRRATEKRAFTAGDVKGMLTGGYGIYGGLTGLIAGSIAYDQMKKRSRRAILEKALAKRERRRFALSPPEIYATPEPMEPAAAKAKPGLSRAEAALLKTAPEDETVGGLS
jgi:hypothetical protein